MTQTSSLGFGIPNITIDGNAMCDLGTAAEIETGTENGFALRIDSNEPIIAEKLLEWNHFTSLEDVGYVCEQEGKVFSTKPNEDTKYTQIIHE